MELRCPHCLKTKDVGASHCPHCTHKSSLMDELIVEFGGFAIFIGVIVGFIVWANG